MANSQHRRNAIIITVAIIIIICCAGIFLSADILSPASHQANIDSSSQPPSESVFDSFIISNLNVGKADCAVLNHKNTVGLIDTGTYESYETLSGYLQKEGIQKIDYLILTHYDQDHIGGAVLLLQDYEIDRIYLPDYVSDKKYFTYLMNAVSDRKNTFFVNEDTSLTYGDLTLEILPADEPASLLESEKNRDNNMSLVTMATFGERKFLFTGDIEKARIAQMLSFHDDLEADWIKMPHHGEYQKKISQLLEAVLPKYAVISTSQERPPDTKLLDLLKSDNITTYDTMTSNVVTISDGKTITVQ